MVYLVTGGGGLIGSRVVRDLAAEGEQVVLYDLSPQREFLEQLLSEEERTRVKIERGDITDLSHLIRTVKENKVGKIIHLASLLLADSAASPLMAIKVNCEGTVNIFEIARNFAIKKVVWASAIGVFGSKELYAEEYVPNNAAHYPPTIYGGCKSFNEVLAQHYINEYGLDISAIRPSFAYGMGARVDLIADIMTELIEKPALGKPSVVPFGDESFGWHYVNDTSRAIILISKAAKPKTKVFNLAGEIHTLKEAVNCVKKLLPKANIRVLAGGLPGGPPWKLDMTPLREEIGYTPQWSLEAGLKDSINIVRRQHGLSLL